MSSICGIDCGKCQMNNMCKGCLDTCGKPFGGECIAAMQILKNGKEAYCKFKNNLLNEINKELTELNVKNIDTLYELSGSYVNLEYFLPSGEKIKFLDDKKIYLGAQIEIEGFNKCLGVIADSSFILICTYGENSANPELIIYKKR